MSIAAHPTYNSYREISASHVDRIPNHWSSSRIRHAADISPSRRLDGNIGREDEVVFLPMEAVGDNGQIDQSNRRVASEVSEGFTYFQRGDVIMAKITPCFENGKGAYLKALETDYGFGTTELHVMRPKGVTGDFLYYFLKRKSFRSYSEVFMVGSAGQKRVSTGFLKNQLIPIPPLPEQRAITTFLDKKCAKIDEAVRIKEAQITLLRERRQILIQQAVTRGLNSDAPMKDSGIDWIGEIPVHWVVRRNFALFQEIKMPGHADLPVLSVSIHSGVSKEELSEEENIRSVIKIADRSAYKKVLPGDIAYNMMRAWQGGVGAVHTHGMVSPAYMVARPVRFLKADYFELLYRTSAFINQMDSGSRGITDFRKRLYWDDFRDLVTLLPPADEQKDIIKYSEQITQKVNNAISIKQDQVGKLKEYKATLINAAVTGKIKVS